MKSIKLKLTPEVIDAINGEFEYQFQMSLNSNRTDHIDHGVEGQLVTLDAYTRKAIDAWTNSNDSKNALDEIRKVATIACRAMILYGVVTRNKLTPP